MVHRKAGETDERDEKLALSPPNYPMFSLHGVFFTGLHLQMFTRLEKPILIIAQSCLVNGLFTLL